MGEEEHFTAGTRFPALGQLVQRMRRRGRAPCTTGKKHTSAENLAKTELAFGADIRHLCQRHNLSMCWRMTPPPGGVRSLAEVRARIVERADVVDEE